MNTERLGALLSDPEFKNPLGLPAKEVAADFVFFLELMVIHAPMALYSFVSPLVGSLVQTYGEPGFGVPPQPEGFIAPMGTAGSAIPAITPTILTS
jgi:hypothetical protein